MSYELSAISYQLSAMLARRQDVSLSYLIADS